MNILVSLDGGAIYVAAPQGVRILYDGVDVPGEDRPGRLAWIDWMIEQLETNGKLP